jgi:glycosyltransferase involved in cell wall biosynthesis
MSNASQPLVSILTPSFNQAAWLSDNLRSVACQTYPRVEHIVMDGGSTDDTIEMLTASGGSVIWRSEPDRGQANAVNKAFALSRGDIIGWINSDDAYFDCRVIEDVVACFSAHPEADVVFGHCLQTTADGAFIQMLWAPRYDAGLMKVVDPLMQPSTFIRRRALGETMLDESFDFAMDYELWLRLEEQSCRFLRMGRVAAIDRHHGERKSRTIKDVNESDLQRLALRYSLRLSPEAEAERSRFYVSQRLRGALLIPSLRGGFAFTVPAHPKRGLLRRQIWSRRSSWPEEYR